MTVQRIRNVRPPSDHVSDHDPESDVESSGDEDIEMDGVGEKTPSDAEESESSERDEEEGDESDESDEDVPGLRQLSNVSFGALKYAQDSLPQSGKRKRGSDTSPAHEDKLQVLRERLRQIKQQKAAKPEDDREIASDSDSDSGPSEEDAPLSRTSKHAPTAQSTKFQVSRKRQVVDVPKRVVRDPRFDAMHQRSAHPGNSEKAYGFLRDYEKSEINELKEAAKRMKNEHDKEKLKRKAGSMENRLKAREAKEREQEVVRRHRKEERDRVQQGKTPYYLKEKDIKERALVEKFNKMKSKDREKLIERKRRKEGQKEKKRMPDARRIPSD